jgi:predicted kinase/transcriptional regulator with XRE-family HTH domain
MGSPPAEQRYCRCGTRLAADNTGGQCARCQRASRNKLIAPPQVPAEFWRTEQLRDAFVAQHMGWVARAYRLHPYHQPVYGPSGISQGLLGQWLGLSQPQVSRIENGSPIRNLDTLAYWARILHIPPELLWFRLPEQRESATASSVGVQRKEVPAVVGLEETDNLELMTVLNSPTADRLPSDEQAFATLRRALAGLRHTSGPEEPGSTPPSLDQRVLDAWAIRRQAPPQRPALVLIAGFAGSGKTEFGTFLSALTGWSLLDKDIVTRPLTEALLISSGGNPHDRHTAVYREKVRPLEYRSLMAAAFHNVDCDVSTIVAAPFCEEVSDRDWIARVANRCTACGTDVAVVWVSCDSASMHEYLTSRGAARDAWKLAYWDDYLASIDLDLVPCCRHAVVDNRNNAATSLADQARELATHL